MNVEGGSASQYRYETVGFPGRRAEGSDKTDSMPSLAVAWHGPFVKPGAGILEPPHIGGWQPDEYLVCLRIEMKRGGLI